MLRFVPQFFITSLLRGNRKDIVTFSTADQNQKENKKGFALSLSLIILSYCNIDRLFTK